MIQKLYQNSQRASERTKSIGHSLHDLNVQQSFPGKNFDDLSIAFRNSFQKSLMYEELIVNKQFNLESSGSHDAVCVSLTRWCVDTVVNASQKAYFGEYLSIVDPGLAQAFVEFDTQSWKLLYHFPRFLSRQMYFAKDRLIKALALYFDAPAGEKTDAAWVTKLLERDMRQLRFSSEEMATLMLLQYWG